MSKDLPELRTRRIAEIQKQKHHTLYLPWLDSLHPLINDVQILPTLSGRDPDPSTKAALRQQGYIYWWGYHHRDHGGRDYGVTTWVLLQPCLQRVINSGCVNGTLGCLELIDWKGDDEGLSLLIGHDTESIGRPWVTVLETALSRTYINGIIETKWQEYTQRVLDHGSKKSGPAVQPECPDTEVPA